jgi:hypothetical protein
VIQGMYFGVGGVVGFSVVVGRRSSSDDEMRLVCTVGGQARKESVFISQNLRALFCLRSQEVAKWSIVHRTFLIY